MTDNSKYQHCKPNFEKIHLCMKNNEQYSEYEHLNTFKNHKELPNEKYIDKDYKTSHFSSYDNHFNYFDPKTVVPVFMKCSKSLLDQCVSKLNI